MSDAETEGYRMSREDSSTKEPLGVGDKVNKSSGYSYPGIVVAKFLTTKKETRYVVEATGRDYKGMLHIFNEQQLQKI